MIRSTLPAFFDSAPSTEEVDVKIQSVLDQIARLHDDVRSLQRYKNAQLSAISKLPIEVLSIIFRLLTIPEPPPPPEIYTKPYANLLAVTHVCLLWRQVALNSPRLWGCIYPSAPRRLVKMCLQRAGSAPLYLYIDRLGGDCVFSTLKYFDRLKEIYIFRCTPEWLKQIASTGAPNLEVLSLRGVSHFRETTFQFAADPFPALKHLELPQCIPKLNMASLTSLRSLNIGSLNRPTSLARAPLPDIAEFFAALDNLPFLSSLVLFHSLSPPRSTHPVLSIALPSLESLYITHKDRRVVAVVPCITMPRIKTIQLTIESATYGFDTSLLSTIYAKLPILADSHSKFHLVTDRKTAKSKVRLWRDCTGEELDEVQPFFELSAPGMEILTVVPPTTLPPILSYTSEVKVLSNDRLAVYRQSLLYSLADVTELHADRLMDLVIILCDNHAGLMCLPSLKKMVLTAVTPIKYRYSVIDRLKKELEARRAISAPIETFRFPADVFSFDEIDSFRHLVDSVGVTV
ncbi:hypothetical protein CCMSSC00406_0010335 [Pleurotus cornucopiae]|uniref:Uncharacterized protein n=1 Tax=Pleurotus cornucopiae TaxID=5321 RepID=A0ACB7INX8_PLECO|nr:hypothetical protein CCMSSC00406_0010335 [Pleurotus cornucopiae]